MSILDMPVKFLCQLSSYDKKELETDIDIEHAVDESFINTNSTVELKCPECDQLFMADHTSARHVYEEHFYSFTCTHCNKHLPGEDKMADIHYKMCPAPFTGHPFCHCKL